jgi:hypothetical protein
VRLGKDTSAFTSPWAHYAEKSTCLSLITPSTTLDLEAVRYVRLPLPLTQCSYMSPYCPQRICDTVEIGDSLSSMVIWY